MPIFLTPEWVDALDRAAAGLAVDAGATLCVEHVVGRFVYHVDYAGGRVRFRTGPAGAPTVRFLADPDTATAIAQGSLSAQRAFMNGMLRIEGDTLALANAHSVLGDLGDAFAVVRDDTEW